MPTAAPSRAAAAFTTSFAQRDFAPAAAVLADDVEFRSPVLATPWRSRPVVERLVSAMVTVFDDLAFAAPLQDDRRAALGFTGRHGDLDVEGVLLLDTDAAGDVERMAILLRPLSALQAVAAAMAARLDPALLAGHGR